MSASLIILYVENLQRSVDFYSGLLEKPAVEQSENFALFPVNAGLMLGLWTRDEVRPLAVAGTAVSEIALEVANPAAVVATCENWSSRGLKIIQSPTDMDFGHTFVAVDDDGHRLRVFSSSKEFDDKFRNV